MLPLGLFLGLALALALSLAPSIPAASLPKIRVTKDGRGFVTGDGQPFVPFGVTYYRPGTGWAPQVWKKFDPAATRQDFARLRAMGGNCVRVFLTYASFHSQPGRVDPEGLAKLDTFLQLAEEAGLYVHPTGPDHWEGLPDWARTDRVANPKVVEALESYWRELATHLKGRSVVFAYDLLNEPEVGWDSPLLLARWNDWLNTRYGTVEARDKAWARPGNPATTPTVAPASARAGEETALPPTTDAPLDPRLLDFQHFREDLAETWTRRQAQAIKAVDPEALVTVGLIQWSVPVVLAHVGHYSAFRPDRQAPWLDFLTFHFYPLEHGAYEYENATAEARNLGYLELLAREHARFGKPVMIGEFGWTGGGKAKAFKNSPAPPATEEQQARWCSQVVTTTEPWVTGWLNWGFHDQPEATDPSEFTGLLRADGTEKAWGREFTRLATRLTAPAPARAAASARTAPTAKSVDLPWDRLVTSRKEIDAFRGEFLKTYLAEHPAGAPKP